MAAVWWKGLPALGLLARSLGMSARVSISPFLLPLLSRYDLTYTDGGLLFSAFVLSYGLLIFPGGLLADRIAPRRLAIIGTIGVALGVALTGLAPSFPLAVAGRILSGAGTALLFIPSFQLFVLAAPRSQRGRAVSVAEIAGVIALAIPLGLFPVLEPWIGIPGLHLLLAGAAGLVALGLGLSRTAGTPVERAEPAQAGPFPARPLAVLIVMTCLAMIAANNLVAWLPTYLEVKSGWHGGGIAASMTLMMMGQVLGATLCVWMIERIRSRAFLYHVGGLLLAAATLLLAVADRPSLLLIGIFAAGLGIPIPFVMTFHSIGIDFPNSKSGLALGLVQAFSQLTGAFSGVAFGAVIDLTGDFTWAWMTTGFLLLFRSLLVPLAPGVRPVAAINGDKRPC